jgi:2-polyprenyl-3-methyl-5-hydroxy-6-metoxy-1,4-benzoquinol methylase
MLMAGNANALRHMSKSAGQSQTYKLRRHALGFLQADPLPTADELQQYYRDQYFQRPAVATYARRYDEEEQSAQQVPAMVADYVAGIDAPKAPRTLLDVGCGEGIFMQAMADRGWDVHGMDYSEEGVHHHRPSLLPKLQVGDSVQLLRAMQDGSARFGMVNLGNIVEHVLDPVELLLLCRGLVEPGGLLRVVVPNDGSAFQALLEREGLAGKTWFAPPDHLSYFDEASLNAILKHCGCSVVRMLGDFPIELFLLNESSNYVRDRNVGASAHRARIKAVNFVASQGVERYVRWAQGLIAGGTSRSCIAFARQGGTP